MARCVLIFQLEITAIPHNLFGPSPQMSSQITWSFEISASGWPENLGVRELIYSMCKFLVLCMAKTGSAPCTLSSTGSVQFSQDFLLNLLQKRKLFDLQEASMGVKFYLFFDTVNMLITCFHEFWIHSLFQKSLVCFLFLQGNLFAAYWKKKCEKICRFKICDNIWWTRWKVMNELVVSLPAEKLVFKVNISVSGLKSAKIIPLAGNGRTCKGNGLCGDGDEAVKASLTYPKVNT